MTTVEATLRRSLNYSSFVDITDAPLEKWTRTAAVFGGDLTDEQVGLIWARMESTDDADQTRRAALRADRDALEPGADLRRLYNYVLGD